MGGKHLILLTLLIICTGELFSQGSAGSKAYYETRNLVDMPTAGVIPKGTFSVYGQGFSEGGLLCALDFAPFKNFNIGLSYSGSHLIGDGNMTVQGLPGVNMKFRFIDESLDFPAIAAGIDIQGRGHFSPEEKRFQTLSPGVFVAVSKYYKWFLGSISVHGGVNYSFEAPPEDRVPNFYLGFEHSIGSIASLNMEYNANIDDNNNKFLQKRGLLNAALRLTLTGGFTLELQARDLLQHYNGAGGMSRCLSIEYIGVY